MNASDDVPPQLRAIFRSPNRTREKPGFCTDLNDGLRTATSPLRALKVQCVCVCVCEDRVALLRVWYQRAPCHAYACNVPDSSHDVIVALALMDYLHCQS